MTLILDTMSTVSDLTGSTDTTSLVSDYVFWWRVDCIHIKYVTHPFNDMRGDYYLKKVNLFCRRGHETYVTDFLDEGILFSTNHISLLRNRSILGDKMVFVYYM